MLETVIGPIGALAGVVIGSVLTFVFTRRAQTSKALHDARLASFARLAATSMEYRRTLMARWFADSNEAKLSVGNSVYETRSAAWAALFEVQLVARTQAVSDLAKEAVKVTDDIRDSTDQPDLALRADLSRTAVEAFIKAARSETASKSRAT